MACLCDLQGHRLARRFQTDMNGKNACFAAFPLFISRIVSGAIDLELQNDFQWFSQKTRRIPAVLFIPASSFWI